MRELGRNTSTNITGDFFIKLSFPLIIKEDLIEKPSVYSCIAEQLHDCSLYMYIKGSVTTV